MNVPSPCIGICRLDRQDVCLGCFRTRDEIARWMQMAGGERLFVIATLDKRKNALCSSEPGSTAPEDFRRAKAR